ncbi:MAG: Gfo/Idh/MocA family oxidoreductase [Ginsengibacter sp.]
MRAQKKLKFITTLLLACCLLTSNTLLAQTTGTKPIRVAIAGLSHDHVGWILSRKKPDVVIAGIYESNNELAQRYAKKYGFDNALIYNDLNKMLDVVKPEAVLAFGSVLDHYKVVEAAAPRHINVMVEKPLATTYDQALKMADLAKKNNILLLTNFETSWYPTTAKTYSLINDSNAIGKIKKVVIHDGHEGPKEIGVTKEFFSWLTDPVQNGGGALIDFGCYGANLMTWLMHGEKPISVTAVTQQFKPSIYPKVDDEATIIVSYPSAQCIIQASWNWPFGRKDMEVYGDSGYIKTINATALRTRLAGNKQDTEKTVTAADIPVYEDPFSYLADVLNKKITVPENGLYALPTNITTVQILDAARRSAASGKTIMINDSAKH